MRPKIYFFRLMAIFICLTTPKPIGAQQIAIDLNIEYQTVTGFGGMNMPGWINDLNEDQVDKAFGNLPGQIGLSILRIRVPNDTTQFYREIPTAVLAKNLGASIFATPWSPPAYMKSNNNIVGGYLPDENYDLFADHLLGFASYMKENGSPLSAISIQNEPDYSVNYESCSWSARQFINFLEEQGPKFDSVKLIAPESFQFRRPLSDSILNDTGAVSNLDIIGGHIYGGGLFDYPLARQKGKEVWMTEHLTGSSGLAANTWSLALDLASEINNCMKANFNAYVWWYLRRFYGPMDDAGNITFKGYVMSQFSKFVRPGMQRIGVYLTSAPNVDVTAYKNDTSFVIVIINRNSTPTALDFSINNAVFDTLTKFTTSAVKAVQNDGLIIINANSFNTSVDASSITTLTTYAEVGGLAGNISPEAFAGSDTTLNDIDNNGSEHLILDGSSSSDIDGNITNYSWSENGVQIAWQPVYELDVATGEHQFVLTITDNNGARDYDTLSVNVNSLYNTHIWLEAECGLVGSNWNILADNNASNSGYVIVHDDLEMTDSASANTDEILLYNFHIIEPGVYKLWGRTKTPSANDDSFWIKMNEGEWANWNSIPTSTTWQWDDVHDQNNANQVVEYILDTGYHQLSICYRENGAPLDKLYLTNTGSVPSGLGDDASNCPIVDTVAINNNNIAVVPILSYPNPAHNELYVVWEKSFEMLEIYSTTGECLISKNYSYNITRTVVELHLKPGIYLVKLSNNLISNHCKIVVQ